MERLKITDKRSKEKVKEMFSRVYGLRVSEYTLTDFDDEVVITMNSPEKSIDSKVQLTTDGGAFHGYLSLYPSINEGQMLTYEEILAYIGEEGVSVNIQYEMIEGMFERFANGEIVEGFLVAEGIPPLNGRDAEMNIHFAKLEKRPKITEDGKVDYKNVDNIVMVRKGDLLISKKPATSGVRGMNIKHEEVSAMMGKDIQIFPGDGATVNEMGTMFTATVDGYVDFNKSKISVFPVYIVPGNVDYSVGNISFNGSVHVKGEVLSGFKIEADKHILVDGTCQDCELIAKGNVILRTGVRSTGSARVEAGGSAIIGYAEKARIRAKEDIEIRKYAFNCELFAGNKIDAQAGDGIIAGGSIRAFSEIIMKQLGTLGNTKFTLSVGTKYYIEAELERLRKEKQRLQETLTQVKGALTKFDLSKDKILNHPKIQKMLEVLDSLNKLIIDLDEREGLLIKGNMARSPKIKVKGNVFEGATVTFYNVASVIREPMNNVVFYYDTKYSEVSWVSMRDVNSIESV